MLHLTCHITIETASGTLTLESATEVSIKKDTDVLCDTATITLPRRVRWKNAKECPITRGCSVRIMLGYNGRNHLAFVGTVRTVSPATPMVIECVDLMAQYQAQQTIKKSYASTTLNQLLADQGIAAQIKGTQSIGAYRVECNTVSELLDALKKQGIRSLMRIGAGTEPVLYAGMAMSATDARTFSFSNLSNMVSRAGLQYTPQDSVRFLVRVKNLSTKESGKRSGKNTKPIEVGFADGELRTFNVINMTKEEMKTYANEQLERLKHGGLSGDFTAFGGEIVDKLDAVHISLDGTDLGTWQVEKNTITWGASGFRQKITIGTKLS